jgi:hypothetical protein
MGSLLKPLLEKVTPQWAQECYVQTMYADVQLALFQNTLTT